MRVLIIALAVAASSPALAEVAITYPVSIPQECVELAQREGVPVVIASRFQAVKARIKLARLSGADPMVKDCRAAVERLRRSVEQVANTSEVRVAVPLDHTKPQ